MAWIPVPLDVSGITLPDGIGALLERLAEDAHDRWAARRMAEGWRYGTQRDDAERLHPDLVPYGDLPDSERDYDRELVAGNLKAILALGWTLGPPNRSAR